MDYNKEQLQHLKTELDNTYLGDYFCAEGLLQYSDAETAEELMEYIQERIYETEVVYYSKAIEFLKDNDPSLGESMQLACDMCLSVENINSEMLATLLLQDYMTKELYEMDLEGVFEDE